MMVPLASEYSKSPTLLDVCELVWMNQSIHNIELPKELTLIQFFEPHVFSEDDDADF